mmetsp:Transcript_70128/g.186858  ORF Transcript_70128/g.186858 Transcript_70128/m.186858 type:complete len:212 (+) Transcript_70128:52-687(+)
MSNVRKSSSSSGVVSPTGSGVTGVSTRSVKISFANFDEHRKVPPFLNSPRSLEACERQGVLPEELMFRSLHSFFDKSVPEQVVQMRFDHYEARRHEKLSQVREEYRVILGEIVRPSATEGNATERSAVNSVKGEEEKLYENMRRSMEAMKRNMKEEVEQILLSEFKLQLMFEVMGATLGHLPQTLPPRPVVLKSLFNPAHTHPAGREGQGG